MVEALEMIKEIRYMFGSNIDVCDVTAGTGGDCICFSQVFRNVIAFEPDKVVFGILNNNIGCYKNRTAANNRIITSIEVLSPSNKAAGEGRREYLLERQELLRGGVNLVEIDLLRAGNPTLRLPPEKTKELSRGITCCHHGAGRPARKCTRFCCTNTCPGWRSRSAPTTRMWFSIYKLCSRALLGRRPLSRTLALRWAAARRLDTGRNRLVRGAAVRGGFSVAHRRRNETPPTDGTNKTTVSLCLRFCAIRTLHAKPQANGKMPSAMRYFVVVSLLLVACAVLPIDAQPAADLLVGFGECDITPDPTANWFGLPASARTARRPRFTIASSPAPPFSSHDNKKIAIVSVDVVGLFNDVAERVRKRLPGFSYVLVSSTHNHEGPDTMGLWGPNLFTSGIDADYMKQLEAGIVKAVERGRQAKAPARRRHRHGQVPELLHDDREPYRQARRAGRLADQDAQREDGRHHRAVELPPGDASQQEH